MTTKYTVIVKDGECVNGDLRAISPSITYSCGHDHRAREAAERCHQRLLGWSRGPGGQRECSAKWYNAQIHAHAPGTMDYPANDEV